MRHGRSILAAVVLVCGPAAAPASNDGLARTPYMGWNSYFALGGYAEGFPGPNEKNVRAIADAMVALGLRDAGYDVVWLDGGWWRGERRPGGNIKADLARFPSGMRALAAYLHGEGLRAGIYSDAGSTGCSDLPNGSRGHYQQDADLFATWGYDAVKIDFCGGNRDGLDPRNAFTKFAAAIRGNHLGRPMVINLCNPGAGRYDTWSFAPPISHGWRTDGDIGVPGHIPWSRVVRNLDSNAAHPGAAGPGGWSDPDYLGPGLGMSATESEAQFLMWSIMAAPLILGSDPRELTADQVALLTNPEVIAIDQDPDGIQGRAIADHGDTEVWSKPLAGGDVAVALFNRGDAAATIATTTAALGIAGPGPYAVRDTVRRTTRETDGPIEAEVPRHGAVLLRISPITLEADAGPGATLGPDAGAAVAGEGGGCRAAGGAGAGAGAGGALLVSILLGLGLLVARRPSTSSSPPD